MTKPLFKTFETVGIGILNMGTKSRREFLPPFHSIYINGITHRTGGEVNHWQMIDRRIVCNGHRIHESYEEDLPVDCLTCLAI